jgi:hypothetical protein
MTAGRPRACAWRRCSKVLTAGTDVPIEPAISRWLRPSNAEASSASRWRGGSAPIAPINQSTHSRISTSDVGSGAPRLSAGSGSGAGGRARSALSARLRTIVYSHARRFSGRAPDSIER